MHVTILELLTGSEQTVYHYTEDDVFVSNEEFFPDGVTEHAGEEVTEDIDAFKEFLGVALAGSGTEKNSSNRQVPWVEIDTKRLYTVFGRYFDDAKKAIEDLSSMTLLDFSTGSSEISSAMYRLKSAYGFDGFYALDLSGGCTPISEWLRSIQSDDAPRIQRFYVHSTYDGDQ
jgi:hypothetical protein